MYKLFLVASVVLVDAFIMLAINRRNFFKYSDAYSEGFRDARTIYQGIEREEVEDAEDM